MARRTGIESFWTMIERGCQGVFHRFSRERLDRHVGEFAMRCVRNA